eukprot:3343960-Pleurochrysis_carterae.AAC.1
MLNRDLDGTPVFGPDDLKVRMRASTAACALAAPRQQSKTSHAVPTLLTSDLSAPSLARFSS